MKLIYTAVAAVALVGISSIAQAIDEFAVPGSDTRSGVLDDTGMRLAATTFAVTVRHDAADPDLYINEIAVVPQPGWDPDIDFQFILGQYGWTNGQFQQGDYVLGTPINQNIDWTFYRLASHFGTFSNVAPGTYNFRLKLFGGDSAGASDQLASFLLHVRIIDRYDISVAASFPQPTLGLGGTTEATVSVDNGGTEDFLTSTWYVAGFGKDNPYAPQNEQLTFTDFLGNWFGQVITPGNSRSDLHSRWSAGPSLPLGTYLGDIGIIGGIYEGDSHNWQANPATIEVVGARVSGTLHLSDFSGDLTGAPLMVEVWQSGTLVETVNTVLQAGGNFKVSPAANGLSTLKFRTRSGLKRAFTTTLSGTPVTGVVINVDNGDVDHSGEVDAADIDAVIAAFGAVGDNPADVDGSLEIDAADIDIVIAHFGSVDD